MAKVGGPAMSGGKTSMKTVAKVAAGKLTGKKINK